MAPAPKPDAPSARSGAETENTTPSLAARLVGTQTPRTLRKAGGSPRKRSAEELSAKLIARIYEAFCERPNCDRLADHFSLPKLTVVEAVIFQISAESRKVWSQRRPATSETRTSVQGRKIG